MTNRSCYVYTTGRALAIAQGRHTTRTTKECNKKIIRERRSSQNKDSLTHAHTALFLFLFLLSRINARRDLLFQRGLIFFLIYTLIPDKRGKDLLRDIGFLLAEYRARIALALSIPSLLRGGVRSLEAKIKRPCGWSFDGAGVANSAVATVYTRNKGFSRGLSIVGKSCV